LVIINQLIHHCIDLKSKKASQAGICSLWY